MKKQSNLISQNLTILRQFQKQKRNGNAYNNMI